MRDRAQPLAARVQLEHPAHNCRLGLINHKPVAGGDAAAVGIGASAWDLLGAVAVGEPSGVKAALRSAPQPTMRVRLQLLEVFGGHDALDARAEVVDRTAGVYRVGALLGCLEPVSDPAEVFLVSRETGEVPAKEHVPLGDAGHELKKLGPLVARRTRDPRVLDCQVFDDVPATGLRELAATGDLVG